MAEYTQKDKQLALGVVERHGGVVSKEALDDIRRLLHAPELNKTTVYRWWQGRAKLQAKVATQLQSIKKESTPATDKTPLQLSQPIATLSQDDVDKTLASYFAITAMKYLDHANDDDVIAETKGKDAIMAAAIAVDKMRVLLNLPTEIIEILPGVLDSIKKTGRNPYEVLSAFKARCDAEPEYQH